MLLWYNDIPQYTARSVMMLFITLGLGLLVSAIVMIRRQANARHLAPRPVVISTTPRRRR